MVGHTCNISIQEAEAGGSEVQVQLELYVARFCHKKKTKN
jgi:hypothetical protein